MSFSVEITSYFKKQAKFLLKKYPSLKSELETLIDKLEVDPIREGPDLGAHCYKVRISIASKNKGKAGGARVIIHERVSHQLVYLLSVFDRGNQDSISDSEIKAFVDLIPKP